MTAPSGSPAAATRAHPSALGQLRSLSRAMFRSFCRDRTALFFTFFFPLMFLVVFGLVFRSDSAPQIQLGVVGAGPVVEGLPAETVERMPYDSTEAAVDAVEAGDVPAVLVQEPGGARLYFSAADAVRAGTIQQVVDSVVNRINLAASGQPPALALSMQQVESADFEPIQFLTPGILSWGVATSAAFGAALTLVSWRRRQVLRRLRLSPAPVWTVVGARVGVSMLVACLQAALFVSVAVAAFGLQLSGSWWLALPVLLCGTASFLAVGLFIGAFAKTEDAATSLANFVILPLAFLSGTFFDLSLAPAWFEAVSRVLPLRWMNEGMTDVLIRGEGVAAVWLPCAALLGFAAVVALLATRFFRWEE